MSSSPATRKILLGVLIASSLFLAAAILADWLPMLRGPAPETKEWYWPYMLRPVQQWWPSAGAAVLMWGAATWWLSRDEYRGSHTLLALSTLALTSILLQLGLIYADRRDVAAELVDRTLSHLSSGFFMAATNISDMNAALSNYPEKMLTFISEHARTHPPGLVTANWLTIQAFAKLEGLAEPLARLVQPLRCTDLWLLNRPASVSAALGMWSVLPLVFAASTVFPAYLVARELLAAPAARLAAVLAGALPALLIFAPKSVQIYAPLSLLMFWVFHTGLVRRSPWRLMVAGLFGSILTFLSLGNVTLFFLLFLYALGVIGTVLRQDRLWPDSKGRLVGLVLAFGAGAVSVWLFYWVTWGVPPWEIARVGLEQHYELVTNLRNYRWWVTWNLLDLLIFSGWPVAFGFLGGLVVAYRIWRQRKLEASDILAIVLAVVVLFLDLSGSSRGEVGRLWLFLMPLIALVSGGFWSRLLPGPGPATTILALQLMLVLCLGWAWQPVRPVIVVAQEPAQRRLTPEIGLDVAFATEPVALVGFTLDPTELQSGGELGLTLFWQSEGPASRPYTVFNHLLDANGQLQTQQDGWSVDGQWPPTCWRAGDIIVDVYTIPIPADLEPGTYSLFTGMYDSYTGERLQIEGNGNSFDLGKVEIAPR